ncbi:MAG TPA: hypothetical protein VGU20_02705 [Stellaceae bacterium]|nr:hypothetical protein [Stellaceae bacterium]
MEALLDERRLVSRTLRYWRELGLRGTLPSMKRVDPWFMADDWASCALIEIHPDLEKSTFLTIGDKLWPSDKHPLNGRRVQDCPSGTVLGIALSKLSIVMAKRAPVTIGGSSSHLGMPMLYRSVLLPLAEDGLRIDTILIAANYRRVKAQSI